MKPDVGEERDSRKIQMARRNRRLWRRIVTALSCVVVFCTTYALILPAITMSEDTYCGIEEHTHTEECYERQLVCGYDDTQPPQTEPARQAHTHTEACWETQSVLTCTIPEGHVHGEDCYTRPIICGLEEGAAEGEEGEPHVHTEQCLGEPELVCTEEENHVHADSCYTQETVLTCGLEEWEPEQTDGSESVPDEEPAHVHTDDCYEQVLICEKEEHVHSLACYANPEADLETPDGWRQSLPGSLTENWPENILAIARSQLGYGESTLNYLVDDDNFIHGYTRYGAWAGDPYGDWNTLFAAFCLRYANVPSGVFPDDADCARWLELLSSQGLYRSYGADTPAPGDILFLDSDADGAPDRVGIFTGSGTDENGETYLDTIEGDCDGTVNAVRRLAGEQTVLGFGQIPENPDTGKYTCGSLAHVHESSCYDSDGNLQCGFTAHTHDETCRTGVQEFDYEDEELTMHITVEGPQTEDLKLDVAVLDGEDYALFSDRQQSTDETAESEPEKEESESEPEKEEPETAPSEPKGEESAAGAEETDKGLLLLRGLTLLRGEEAQSLEDYRITAEITVANSVLEPLTREAAKLKDEAAPEAELGVVISALQEDENAAVTEAASADFRPGDAQSPKLKVQVQDGIVALAVDQYPNPTYTVQYYANIPRFAESGDASLTVFDTTDRVLPSNSGSNKTKNIYLEATGNTTNKNAGDGTLTYRVATENALTQMYTDNKFEYIKSPNTSYVNKLIDNDSYILEEVWVLKKGKNPTSIDPADWVVYESPENLHFTSRPDKEQGGVILIEDNTCLRLVYNCREADFTTPSTFYDYDISSGQNSDGKWRTGTTGINSESNYGTSGNEQRTWRSYRDVLAFGNANCGTGMGEYGYDGIYLNKHSGRNYGCAFGLVKRLENGKLVYNDYVVAPKLFNDGSAEGKRTYENSSLTFQKVGDTYTLDSANVNGVGSIGGLQDFFNPSPYSGKVWDIFTNDFWPLDSATNKTDPLFGSYEEQVFYQGFENSAGNWNAKSSYLPYSDDGQKHNSFFGMQYAVEFTLSKDYVGPLEYYFFGDDDMWVFLDNTLVCDIGGVHSSVGEYVNLWDYLEKGSEGSHTLTFFYTERGASGSTCYMNFTLPSVSGVNIEQKTARLRVEKEVLGEDDLTKEFEFKIQFFDKNGKDILDDYAYTRYDANGNPQGGNLIICSGGTFSLQAGEYVIIDYLPYGLRYKITEVTQGGYSVTNTVDGVLHYGAEASGTVIIDAANTVTFTNTLNKVGFSLQKLDPDGNPLSGAVFTLEDSSGSPVNAVDNRNGDYAVPSSASDQIVEQDVLYYIASAKDSSWVLAMDTSSPYKATLQEKTGANTQKFQVYRQDDGSYSFRCLADENKWLDLDAGGLSNGTMVHFWDNAAVPTDEVNQKWFLVTNSDGSLTIKPRVAVLNKSNVVVDIKEANFAEGQTIQIWEGNKTDAQKWLLVPENAAAAVTTTQFRVNDQGILSFTGLLPGTYTLTEIEAPTGCIKLEEPITVRVRADRSVTVSGSTLVSVDGSNVVKVTNRYQPKTLTLEKQVQNSSTTEKFSFTVSYTEDGGEPVTQEVQLANGEEEKISIPYNAQVTIQEGEHKGFALSFKQGGQTVSSGEDGSYTFQMKSDVTILAVNTAGYELPETGGCGTAAYTVSGILLIAAACLVIYFRAIRRRDTPSF